MREDQANHTSHAASESGYEKRDVAVGKLMLVTAASVTFVVVVLIVLFQLLVVETEERVYQAVLAPESAALRELRAREDRMLNSYAVIDTALGHYRIPIDRAMKLVADEAFQSRTDVEGEEH